MSTTPKLVSDRYMKALNWFLEQEGKAPLTKDEFMGALSILNRHQRKMLIKQFTELGIAR